MKRNIKTKFKGFRGCQIKAINESDNVAPKVFFRNLYGFKNIKTKELIQIKTIKKWQQEVGQLAENAMIKVYFYNHWAKKEEALRL